MRNFAIVAVALVVLALGVVLATRSDEADAPTGSAEVTTTETVTAEAGAPPAATTTESPDPVAAPAPKPDPVPTVAFAGGKPKGGVQKLEFKKGDDVEFKVTSDVGEEIHVHGFDIKKDIEPGKSVTFAFPAKFDGKYEVEMEGSATQIASLEIQP